jgi:hypothetical protein
MRGKVREGTEKYFCFERLLSDYFCSYVRVSSDGVVDGRSRTS